MVRLRPPQPYRQEILLDWRCPAPQRDSKEAVIPSPTAWPERLGPAHSGAPARRPRAPRIQ